jgi:hypothetical protein
MSLAEAFQNAPVDGLDEHATLEQSQAANACFVASADISDTQNPQAVPGLDMRNKIRPLAGGKRIYKKSSLKSRQLEHIQYPK